MITLSSFFSGCGGLDLGFEKAGFKVIWANEFDASIHDTYRANHCETLLCTSDFRKLDQQEIPDCDGFIGGPPCQSWSEGGRQKGLEDERGRLFLDYVNLIKLKHPKFFVIENVKGIISDTHYSTFISFLQILENAGYVVYYKLLNAADFRIPQDRFRVFVVGFAKELNIKYSFPQELDEPKVTLRKAISDIKIEPTTYREHEKVKPNYFVSNHDVYDGPFDAKYMARNRVRTWDEVSFTIQAQGRNCPLHPQAPVMEFISYNKRIFRKGYESLYRRLSVRECARIQSFPDSFVFHYDNISDGYKMVGNAVPPRLAYYLAKSIKEALDSSTESILPFALVGYYKSSKQLELTIKNKLYYVRSGFRPGAFALPIGRPLPKYLILHNKDNISYFKIASCSPKYLSKDDLIQLGFTPSGDAYIGFTIETICETIPFELKGISIKDGQKVYAPYIIELQ